jgi:hypothetical protein
MGKEAKKTIHTFSAKGGKLETKVVGKREAVNHPAHYGGANNPYEAIKVIEAWDLDFALGNTVKYISRAGKKYTVNKNSEVHALEDLKKAAWYLQRKINNLKKLNHK